MELLFATNNPHKKKEIQDLLDESFNILSLEDVGYIGDIPEDKNTLEENAMQKAEYIYEITGMNCFADDTGLEVDALKGKPGVYSARYAGEQKNSEANIQKLLKELEGKSNRKAHFRTVIALFLGGEQYFFEGIVNGKIIHTKKGESGFGYDPVFIPDGYDITFAEMPLRLKNQISHRSRAMNKLTSFLKKQFTS
ncbi:MAG: non-canonical purine NTP diphosphatase [Bacteroidales bacterium]